MLLHGVRLAGPARHGELAQPADEREPPRSELIAKRQVQAQRLGSATDASEATTKVSDRSSTAAVTPEDGTRPSSSSEMDFRCRCSTLASKPTCSMYTGPKPFWIASHHGPGGSPARSVTSTSVPGLLLYRARGLNLGAAWSARCRVLEDPRATLLPRPPGGTTARSES